MEETKDAACIMQLKRDSHLLALYGGHVHNKMPLSVRYIRIVTLERAQHFTKYGTGCTKTRVASWHLLHRSFDLYDASSSWSWWSKVSCRNTALLRSELSGDTLVLTLHRGQIVLPRQNSYVASILFETALFIVRSETQLLGGGKEMDGLVE